MANGRRLRTAGLTTFSPVSGFMSSAARLMIRVSGVGVGDAGGRAGVGEAIGVTVGRSVGLIIERVVGLAGKAAGEAGLLPQAVESAAINSRIGTKTDRHGNAFMFMLHRNEKVVAIIAQAQCLIHSGLIDLS